MTIITFYAAPFYLHNPYTFGSRMDKPFGYTNGQPSGWEFDVYPDRRGGLGFSIDYTWRF